MQYNGGKQAIGKRWARLIAPQGSLVYWEPFCGMLGVGRYISAAVCIFTDLDPAVISFLTRLQKGWLPPPSLSEEDYNAIKTEGNCYDPLYAFAAYGCSFAGKRWGGYARSVDRNYALNAFNSSKQLQKLLRPSDVFKTSSYNAPMKLSKELTIYCDPPYKDTTRAGVSWSFRSRSFVRWCIETAPQVKALYVSEFQALHPSWRLVDAVAVADGLKATSEKLYRVDA